MISLSAISAENEYQLHRLGMG